MRRTVNSPKNFIIVLLALTTIGGAALAWHQYQELVALRAAALDPNARADLEKKLADLEKSNRQLHEQLAATRGLDAVAEEDNAIAGTNGDQEDSRRRGPRRFGPGQRFAEFREVMAKPEVQALIATQQKAMLDARYAALFRNLGLTSEQSGKLEGLLIDRQNAIQDVWAAARDQGINPRTDPAGFQKLVADAQAPINDSIKSLLGADDYSQFTNYEQTMPQRNLVNTLQQRLSNTDSPLSSAQSDQLVQILASNSPQRANGTEGGGNTGYVAMNGGGRMGGMVMGFGGGAMGGLVGPGSAPITSAAVNQAQSVLNQTQVSVLQQLQQQQQAAQQLQQVIRSNLQQLNAGKGSGNGSAPAQPGAARPSGGG
ncbi:MAG TPA: hypothetical protein VHE61_22635 [Opitutaceae bacterium]|nr:hypothetical protein [Opitutaceae bacterium]